MNDTTQVIVKTIENVSDNSVDLITKIDTFYNSAWDKLIICGTVAFGIIGIIVPLIIQWYQKKTLKISEELLRKEVAEITVKMKTELSSDINKQMNEAISQFEDKMQQMDAANKARTFHLQGNTQLAVQSYSGALSDFITAASNYLVCEDFINLRIVLNLILQSCIPKLSSEEIEDLKISDSDLEKLLKDLTNEDDKGIFTELVRAIRLKLRKIPKTVIEKSK